MKAAVEIRVSLLTLVFLSFAAGAEDRPSPTTRRAEGQDLGTTMRNLRQLDGAPLPDGQGGRKALDEMIKKVGSMTTKRRLRPAAATATTAPTVQATAATTQPTSAPAKAVVRSAVKAQTRPAEKPVIPTRLTARLKKLSAAHVAKPAAIADVLFKGKQMAAAAGFYAQALDRHAKGRTREWALFQLGNCNKATDPVAAEKWYLQLVKEHPESPWSWAAEARLMLIRWYRQNNPAGLLSSGTGRRGK